MLVDTHSHLYDAAFDGDRSEVVRRVRNAGVGKILLPAIDSRSHGALFGMCRDFSGLCFPMMGLHPTHVNDNSDYEKELAIVEKLLADPPADAGGRLYAVGEVGLDLYWSRDFLKEQTAVFERQIELSLRYGLPLAIHTRSAWREMAETLEKYKGRGLRGVMHSFSGSADDYRKIKGFGDFLFGVGGVVTYKKSGIRELMSMIPLSDIVLETDCPYLPPVPFRGKRNESGYLKYICNEVALLTGLTDEEVADITTRNAVRIFGLP